MSFEILRCYIGLAVCLFISIVAAILLISHNKFQKTKAFINSHIKLLLILASVGAIIGRWLAVLAYFGVTKTVMDFDVFLNWSNDLLDYGLSGFMTEYPAISLYMLAGIRGLLRLIGVADNYIITCLVMKTPSILAEVLLAILIYKWASKRNSAATSFLISLLVMYNPAYVLNSAMWGQIDGLLTLFIVLSFYLLQQNKRIPAALVYTGACLIKAQAIFFAPVFGTLFILPLFQKETFKKTVVQILLSLSIGFVVFFALTLPFKQNFTDIWLLDYFKHISNVHPGNTMGALNLFGLHGGNGVSYEKAFLFMDYKTWGYIFISIICVVCLLLCIKSRDSKHHFLLAAFCMASIYMLGVSMHERYIIPIVAIIAAYMIVKVDIHTVLVHLLYTVLAVISQSMVLFDLFGGKTWTFKLFSGISVATFAYFTVVVMLNIFGRKKARPADEGSSVQAA